MNPYSFEDYKEKPELAVPALGNLLQKGQLCLFLGAGASKGFGLPSWTELIADLLGHKGNSKYIQQLSRKSDKDISKLIDDIDDESQEYLKKVHRALYSSVEENLEAQLQRSPLLLAVSALLTGNCRGRITSIITYNYDNILEQYLQMLGYSVCIRTEPYNLSSWADVEINQVHGYLPKIWIEGVTYNNIVLSEKSYRKRRASIDEAWGSFVVNCLHMKCGLFIGLSGDDSSILDIVQRAKDKIIRANDYLGYWLLADDAFDRNYKSIHDVGICPIKLPIKDFPNFLFDICKNAIPN
ncbi:MAG TPA: hypothetical protein ENH23_01810 [candidate division Zixibacteria bacterium]|nr:hypothetical protein [candidate division Zixibacteria bacterium]